MKRYREYCINNHYVNIGDLDKYYQGNMEMVCRHIESNYLVDRKTSSYYVNLYIQQITISYLFFYDFFDVCSHKPNTL